MAEYELSLHDYWRIIRKWKWNIIFSTLVMLLFTFLFTAKKIPLYSATAVVNVEQRSTVTNILVEWFTWYPGDVMETEARVAASRVVIKESLEELGILDKNVSDEKLISRYQSKIKVKVGKGNVLEITAVSENPEEASALANKVAEVYIRKSAEQKNWRNRELREFVAEQVQQVRVKLERAEEALKEYQATGRITGIRDDLTRKLATLKLELKDLSRQYTSRHPRIIQLRDQIRDIASTIKSLSRADLVHTRLKREVDVNEELYTMLNKKYKEALIAEADRGGTGTIIEHAIVPSSPINPHREISYIVGAFVGLVFGLILAMIRENLDTSIGTIEDVEGYLKLPVLGVIPHVPIEGEKKRLFRLFKRERKDTIQELRNRLVIFRDPKSFLSEAYRTLQTGVEFARLQSKGNSILFTSTFLEEGKSITIANFAMASAQMDKSVLLVESDFRRPVVDKVFGLKREPGLSNYLLGTVALKDILKGTTDFLLGELGMEQVRKTRGIENLKVITSGTIPPNPTELLNLKRMEEFISETKEKFDLVLFDSAPVLPVADTGILAPKVDGVLIVYKVGRTARGALRRAKTQLTQARANILGVVLNDIRAGELATSGYYYYDKPYYRYEEEES